MADRPRWTRRRKVEVLGAIGAVVVVGLLLPTALTTWAPLIHFACSNETEVFHGQLWTPAVVANSPYGGNVTDLGLVPPYIPGTPGYPTSWAGLGAPAWNGMVGGAFLPLNVSVYRMANVTVWGPGANSRCSQQYSLTWHTPSAVGQGGVAFSTVVTPNQTSDAGEANTSILAGVSFSFANGYAGPNEPSISTCGGAAVYRNVTATGLTVWTPAASTLGGLPIAVDLPFPATYHYLFPASFGSWQIDNLSAPGGPGGGWAFSFVGPCA